MRASITLLPLGRTGPTLWAHMRLCALRGALAASRGVESFVLHDPRAWLGTAFHQVMEAAAQPGATAAAVEQVWTAAVAEAAAIARSHPLDARFAAPERWPGYFLVRQRAISSAQQAIAANVAGVRKVPRGGGMSVERLLLARGGRLAGRPDRFVGRILTDYKSSIPDAAWSGAEGVLEGYRRQLRLYAAIIAEALGRWPVRGRVVAASGQTMDVPLEPAACEVEANDALAALDSLNQKLAVGAPPEALAKPGEEACNTCPFQALCPSFWRWLKTAGSVGVAERAAAGVLDRIEPGQDGDLYTAYLSIDHPFVPPGIQPFVLRRSIHGDLTASPKSANWRIISAKVKPDGRLRADLSTCVFALDDLPNVVTADSQLSADEYPVKKS